MATRLFQGDILFVVAYSPNGKFIVSGSSEESIHECNAQLLISLHHLYMIDGWFSTPNDGIFGWVALWNRHLDWFPYDSLIISPNHICQANVDSSLFGESWISCWNC